MDDLTSKISEILSDPAAMERIRGLAGMFTQQTNAEQSPPDTPEEPPCSPEQDTFQGLGDAFPIPPVDMMQMMMKIMPLIKEFKKEDNTTRLLNALRPFLSEARRKKLDEAMKILQIMRLMPLLKGGLLG